MTDAIPSIVVYPPHGIARATPCNLGIKLELMARQGGASVCIPLTPGNAKVMRPPACPAELEAALKVLAKTPRGRAANNQARKRQCLDLIRSGSPADLARAYMLALADSSSATGKSGTHLMRTARIAQLQLAAEMSHVSGETMEVSLARIRAARTGSPYRPSSVALDTRAATHPPGSPEHAQVVKTLNAVEVAGDWYARINDMQAQLRGFAKTARDVADMRALSGIHRAEDMPLEYVLDLVGADKDSRKATLSDREAADAIGLTQRLMVIAWRKKHRIAGCRARNKKVQP